MGKIGFVFAGQGAQYTGMGESLSKCSSAAAELFKKIDSVRPETSKQCFEADAEQLMKTDVTQPCVYAVDLACAYALKERGIMADAVAGYSLGELAALTFAGSLTPEEGVRLVAARGAAMQRASELQETGMMAVLKLDDDRINQLASKYDNVYPVNFNCMGQVSVAGLKDQLAQFGQDVKENGGLVRILEVAGGFHSPFMQSAATELKDIFEQASVAEAQIPVYANCTGEKYQGSYTDTMLRQIVSPILWQKSIENMIADGVDTFIEVGPGSRLTKMITRISKDITMLNVENEETLELAVKTAGGQK